MKKYPDVALVVWEYMTDQIVSELKNGLLDCGILSTPLEDKSLQENPLFYESFVAYLSKSSPLSSKKTLQASDINIDDLWLLNEGHCMRNQILNICKRKKSNEVRTFEYNTDSVETLKRMESDVLYEMIKNEHPQIIATVMVFLDPSQAASVLKLFGDELRNELILRIALLEKVQPAALKELNEVMSRSAGPDADFRRSTVGGVVPTAEILNMLSGGLDKEALTTIRNFNVELADAIQEKMFVFEDFNEIEDRSLQTLLLEVPQDTLIVALKGASPKLREKLFKNMAKRAADGVREDLETRPPVKVQEVEEMQKEVIRIARALSDEGRMIMERGKSADAFL
jgi:flagellar motor switch protein FliG